MKLSLLFVYINFVIISFSLIYSMYLLLKKNIGYKQKYFFVYLIIVFITEILGYILRKNFGVNYFYFYFPGVILNVLYFGLFYCIEFRNLSFKRFTIFLTVFSLVGIVFFQYNDGTLMIASNVYLIVVFFDLIMALMWFYQIINNIDDTLITHKQAFWVSTGLLLWSIFNLFRLYPIYFLYKSDNELSQILMVVTNFVTVISYLMYLKGLRCTEFNLLRTFNHFKSK